MLSVTNKPIMLSVDMLNVVAPKIDFVIKTRQRQTLQLITVASTITRN
jgi:hypothetical protein